MFHVLIFACVPVVFLFPLCAACVGASAVGCFHGNSVHMRRFVGLTLRGGRGKKDGYVYSYLPLCFLLSLK